MARLKRLLYPGETILLREERSFGDVVARVFVSFAAVGVSFMALHRGIGHIGPWLDSLGGTISLLTGILAIFLLVVFWPVILGLPFDLLLARRSSDHWRVAVSDQRVLVRRGLLGRGHDEMMRYDIETCLYARAEGKIVLTGAGRDLAIACNQRQADRVVAALGYPEAGS